MDNVINQSNYQDTQNFDIDINKIYNDFIIAIDNMRGYTNVSSISNQTAVNIFKSGDISLSKLKSQISIETTPQESRCHTFLRIIGFPVVSNSYKIYNPGLDILYDSNRIINSKYKLNIAANPISNFRNLSIQRENYNNDVLNIFSNQDINSSVLGLSSAKIRQFNSPLIINSDPFDMNIKNQFYKIDSKCLVGKNEKNLTEFIDINGNRSTLSLNQGKHIIKPFIVDPVIDYTINDSSKLVAIPFVFNKSQLMVKDNIFAARPIIEQIIRDRFSSANNIETSDQSVIDYIKNIKIIHDEPIINKISNGNIYKFSEQEQFIKFLNIIRAMLRELYNAQLIIHMAQEKYYWLPLININGSEFGSDVQGVFLSSHVTSDFITENDLSIIQSKIKSTINQINIQTSSIDGTSDIGGFIFDNFKNTFNTDTSSAFGDSVFKVLQSLTSKRFNILKNAGEALKTIEIIMGEFSGLGLCDIIAVLGALYIMPKNDLLGFLDEDSLKRMNIILGLNEQGSNIQNAMSSFIGTVKDFYNLMDKFYQDLSQNNDIK